MGNCPCGVTANVEDWMRSKAGVEVVQQLVEEEVGVDEALRADRTPLHYAAKHDRFGVARWLMLRGAKVHAKDHNGCTPLMVAVRHNSLHTVREILGHAYRKGDAAGIRRLLDAADRTGENVMTMAVAVMGHRGTVHPVSSTTARTKSRRQYEDSATEGEVSECESEALTGSEASESELPPDQKGADDPSRTPDVAVASLTLEEAETEPSVRGGPGPQILTVLLNSDRAPEIHPRHSSGTLLVEYLRTMHRYFFGRPSKAPPLRPLVECCIFPNRVQDLVAYSLQKPSLFTESLIQLSRIKSIVEESDLPKQWQAIVPDCNYNFRALFGRTTDRNDEDFSPRDLQFLRRLEAHAVSMTPIQAAIYCGNVAATKLLIVLGGRTQLLVADSNGNTALHYAVDAFVRTGSDRVLNFFLRHFAEFNHLVHKTNNNGNRAGQYNEGEALELGLDTELLPIPSIPSMAHHQARIASESQVSSAGSTRAPLERSSTSVPASNGPEHPLAEAVRCAHSHFVTVSSDDDDDSDNEGSDDKEAKRSKVSQPNTPRGSAAASTAAVPGAVPEKSEESSSSSTLPDTVASIRRPRRRRGRQDTTQAGDGKSSPHKDNGHPPTPSRVLPLPALLVHPAGASLRLLSAGLVAAP